MSRTEEVEYKEMVERESILVASSSSSIVGPVAFMSMPSTDIHTSWDVFFPIGLHGEGRGSEMSAVRSPSEMTSKLPSDMVVGLRSLLVSGGWGRLVLAVTGTGSGVLEGFEKRLAKKRIKENQSATRKVMVQGNERG